VATSPRAASHSVGSSRHIPASVKRDVWRRDEGRCAYIGREGRCTERSVLEYHHVQPYAAGGVAATANIELRCRAHNAYEASLFFGREYDKAVENPARESRAVRSGD
jgi:5-methylcytosine-specific restriction endonuclease McrA